MEPELQFPWQEFLNLGFPALVAAYLLFRLDGLLREFFQEHEAKLDEIIRRIDRLEVNLEILAKQIRKRG